MTVQYIRQASLIVAPDTGNGLELGKMHLKFEVHHRTFNTATTLVCRVFNLKEETAKQIYLEFTQVQLKVEYSDTPLALIFKGTIQQVRKGRENATDTYLDIYAMGGDIPRSFSVVNATLAAGHTQQDVLNEINNSFSAYGASVGYAGSPSDVKMPHVGGHCTGQARDYADDFAKMNGMTWSHNPITGQTEFVPINGVVPAPVVVLNSASGLILLPQQTADGITARCLLNPSIMTGRVVHIDNASIQQGSLGPNIGPETFLPLSQLPAITADGFYKVLAVDHTGDTRGNPWYTDLWCISATGGYQGNSTNIPNMNIPAEWNTNLSTILPVPSP